jgi:dTMP kinase
MTQNNGRLIVFEGIDGCGKTTQIRMFHDFLVAQNRDVAMFREPGGTGLGEELRSLLLNVKADGVAIDKRSELFLFLASRAQAVVENYIPLMQRGGIALLDRFIDSSIAYQGAGRYLDMQTIFDLCMFATRGLKPSVSVFIDVPLDVCQQRMIESGKADRFDSEDEEFHARVRDGYFEWFTENATYPYVIVNGLGTPEEVHQRILSAVWLNEDFVPDLPPQTLLPLLVS